MYMPQNHGQSATAPIACEAEPLTKALPFDERVQVLAAKNEDGLGLAA